MDLPQGICAPVLQPHEFQRRSFRTASSRNPFALSGLGEVFDRDRAHGGYGHISGAAGVIAAAATQSHLFQTQPKDRFRRLPPFHTGRTLDRRPRASYAVNSGRPARCDRHTPEFCIWHLSAEKRTYRPLVPPRQGHASTIASKARKRKDSCIRFARASM